MGNFAENLNLGNRFRPPCTHWSVRVTPPGMQETNNSTELGPQNSIYK